MPVEHTPEQRWKKREKVPKLRPRKTEAHLQVMWHNGLEEKADGRNPCSALHVYSDLG